MSRVMDFNKLKSGLTEVQFDCCFPLGFPVKLLFVAHGGSRTLSSMYIPTTPPVKPAISKAPSCCLLDASWLGMGCIWVTFGRFFSLWGRLGGGARVGVAYLGDSTCKGTFQTCWLWDDSLEPRKDHTCHFAFVWSFIFRTQRGPQCY